MPFITRSRQSATAAFYQMANSSLFRQVLPSSPFILGELILLAESHWSLWCTVDQRGDRSQRKGITPRTPQLLAEQPLGDGIRGNAMRGWKTGDGYPDETTLRCFARTLHLLGRWLS